jgi:hypothetical protein
MFAKYQFSCPDRPDALLSAEEAQALLLEFTNKYPLSCEWTVKGNEIRVSLNNIRIGSTPASDRARGA